MVGLQRPYDKNHYRVSVEDRVLIIEKFLPEKKRDKHKKKLPYHSRHWLYIEELIKINKVLMKENRRLRGHQFYGEE